MCPVCPSWLSFVLYNPFRKAFTDRGKVLDDAGITEGSVVLEVGAGNGFFTEAIAGRAKKVIAVELQSGMVRKLKKRVRELADKVDIVAGDVAAIDLGEGIADVCLLYYSFHEIREQSRAAAMISRNVRRGGTLAIYEPAIEVSRERMQKTATLFEMQGFIVKQTAVDMFTRSVLMRKT